MRFADRALQGIHVRWYATTCRACSLKWIWAQVLENESGCKAGTLLGALDRCVTPGGRRLLRDWLLRPLLRVADITARQDAVAALMGPASQAACDARSAFSGELSCHPAVHSPVNLFVMEAGHRVHASPLEVFAGLRSLRLASAAASSPDDCLLELGKGKHDLRTTWRQVGPTCLLLSIQG